MLSELHNCHAELVEADSYGAPKVALRQAQCDRILKGK